MNAQAALLRCPACGTVFRAPPQLPSHRRVRCGVCHELFSAPESDTDPIPRPAYASAAAATGAGGGGIVRAGALVALVLLLVAQLAWLARDRLVVYPRFHALYGVVCHYLGCQVPAFRDLSAIDISAARVTSHPEYADALLAVVSLRNQAQAAQPWPRLALSLTAPDGSTVAGRLFEPAEFLPALNQGEEMFAADAAVHVRLPLADPGTEAASFRFTVH